MSVKWEVSEGVYNTVLQRLHDKVKADCLNPNVQRWNITSVGNRAYNPTPSRALGYRFPQGTPCSMGDAQRAHLRA